MKIRTCIYLLLVGLSMTTAQANTPALNTARAATASLPLYIVSALPLGGSRDITQTFVITREGCDYVEIHFAPAGPTKDHFQCRVLSGSEALLSGRGRFDISLDTPQGVEVHHFALYEQEVSAREEPTETRFVFASLLRVMPSQLPMIRQLDPDPKPPGFVEPSLADLPPPTAAELLHVQLHGTDCMIQYGERPAALCALTAWGPRGATVVVSGAYLQQPEDKVQISLLPAADAADHWLYTPAHFPPHSPLLLAVEHGDIAAVQTLLTQGAAPNSHPPGLDAPLAMAVRRSKLDIANLLVDHDADVNAQDADVGSVLEMAVGHGQRADSADWFEFAKKLIARGADVNRAGRYGLTPLIAAAGAADPDMVELLLDSGANVDATASVPFGEFLFRVKMPMTAYGMAQGQINLRNKSKAEGNGDGDPDSVSRLQKVMSILVQHGAKTQ